MHAEFKCQLHGYSQIIQTARDMLAFEIFLSRSLVQLLEGKHRTGDGSWGDLGLPVTSDLNS